MDKVTLYKKDANGRIWVWAIWQDSLDTIKMKFGLENGSQQTDSELVKYGLGGRTQEQQLESRMKSRINKKIDAGYTMERSEASHGSNALGLPKPMLATNFDKIKNFEYDVNLVQYKYDGHRCLIKIENGNIFAYSRNGKEIKSISHITEQLRDIDRDVILDGELYCHGESLQTITSWVKKEQDASKALKFICYDMIENIDYIDRYGILNKMLNGLDKVIVANTELLFGEFNPKELVDSAIAMGYEGLIIRPARGKYEIGKRSKALIKVKKWLDDEFVVEEISSGVDGQAILHMRIKGKLFSATCHGNHDYKKHVFKNRDNFVGLKVNIQYAGLTKDGIPFHPVATMWRDKDAE